MARMARVVMPGTPHHVTQRGSRRQKTFFESDDYRDYIALLATTCRRAGTQVWAYCLMPNHVHLVLVPSSGDGLRAAVSPAHRQYALRVNERFGWRGHLWQERFYSSPMDERYLHAAVRYVERNPVTAGLVTSAERWPWSSARAHLEGRNDELIEVAPMLQRIDDWAAYLAEAPSDSVLDEIVRHTRTGRPLGNEAFIDGLEKRLKRPLKQQRRGRKSKNG